MVQGSGANGVLCTTDIIVNLFVSASIARPYSIELFFGIETHA